MKKLVTAILLIGLLGLCAQFSDARDDGDAAALMKELKSKNPKTRTSAVLALGKLGAIRASDVKDAVPLVLDLLKKDKEAAVRKAAADALGRMDPDAKMTVPVLIDALKDKDAGVREAAATALGQFSSESNDILPALRDLQSDKNKMVERAAKMSLKNLREQRKQ